MNRAIENRESKIEENRIEIAVDFRFSKNVLPCVYHHGRAPKNHTPLYHPPPIRYNTAMKTITDTIKERRSVRKYTTEMPGDDLIESVLDAGRWAPSGLNNQPWKFLVVKDPERKSALAGLTKYARVIDSAPVAVCVFLDQDVSYNREKDIMAVGACVQNMLLAAYSLGLGTCWLGEILNKKDEVASYLKVPSDCELMAVITLGYPAGEPEKGSRRSLDSFLVRF